MKTKTSILFSKLFGTVAETIRRYPFTCTAIFLFGSVFAICLDQFENGATPFLAAILAAGTGGFLTESIFPRQSKKWALGILVSLGISIAFGFFCPKGEWVFSARLYNRVLAAFCSVTFLLGIWRCIIGSKRTFSEWFYDMSIRMIRAVVLVGVVLIGVLFVGFIFMFLILGSTDFNPILRIELFLFFLLAGIGFLDATRITQENDSQPFFKLLITRIMLPILIIGFVIVYGYIARIAIVHVVPSNEVFRILAVLFLAGMPICVAADSFEKETALLKIGNWLPAAFVPFFGLQGYAIGVRIAQFGITEARYLGVLLMVFEVIFLIFWIFKRKISPILLPVASLLVIVALVIPAFNIFDA